VLNTSRWLTAVGATGLMRRAVLEARAYARHRRAFGQPIESFPLVRRTLASMTCEWLAALHLSWMLTELEDVIDAGTADEESTRFHRFLVNVTKYAASSAATRVVRDGIEILGGNGTIEDFSVLPRLYRDASFLGPLGTA
jgi:alkylation response protein AidB-like acyl-CoA dehydrogenase